MQARIDAAVAMVTLILVRMECSQSKGEAPSSYSYSAAAAAETGAARKPMRNIVALTRPPAVTRDRSSGTPAPDQEGLQPQIPGLGLISRI